MVHSPFSGEDGLSFHIILPFLIHGKYYVSNYLLNIKNYIYNLFFENIFKELYIQRHNTYWTYIMPQVTST